MSTFIQIFSNGIKINKKLYGNLAIMGEMCESYHFTAIISYATKLERILMPQ